MAFLSKRVFCSCFLLGLVVELGSAQQVVSVFIENKTDGFTAAGLGDSAADLAKSLRGKKSMQVVDSPANADFVVRITSRDERKQFSGATTTRNRSDDGKTSTTITTPNEQTIRTVRATLLAGSFQTDLKAESFAWRLAADNLAGQIDRWVKQNYARLAEAKSGRSDANGNGQSSTPSATEGATTPSEATINPGMSPEEVIEAMGEPLKKVTFGQKSLWTYKGLQVVFENNKVTDVKF